MHLLAAEHVFGGGLVKRTLYPVSCASLLLVLSLFMYAQTPASMKQDPEAFGRTVKPVLAKTCYGCHNEKLNVGGLSLEFKDHAAAVRNPELWDKVKEKISTGRMPPPGSPVPSKAEIEAVKTWIDVLLSSSGGLAEASNLPQGSAGRVTARRLNRVEYNNTIRDLLAVHVKPADQFPVDDSGYGFDNIGDVLSVSPMLMEKYMMAASRISKLAIYGETLPPKPTRLARLLNRRSPDVNDVLGGENYFPYSLRGAMYGSWVFPVDGEYEIRLRIANFREETSGLTPEERSALLEERKKQFEQRTQGARAGGAPPRRRELTPEQIRAREEAARNAAPPRKLILTIDSVPVISDVVEGTTSFGYSRGEFTARVPVKAGEHRFRASYPELADLDDPRKNINPDMRRALFVDYIEIVGPFNPTAEPPESYKKVFRCGHSPGKHVALCERKAVENLMRRAYRRPVTPQELDSKLRLVALARKEGESIEEGVRVALEAILVSPNFLFRIEEDPTPAPTPGRLKARASASTTRLESMTFAPEPTVRATTPVSGAGLEKPVSDFELASRLSYFLWGSMPDDTLFALAEKRALRQPSVLEAQIRRMLADPKAKNLVENFAAQWLQLRNLGRTKPDPSIFPTVDDELLDAMRMETSMFLEAVIQEDRSILDMIDAPFTFVNGPLARHYGIKGVSGEAFQRVNLDPEQRGGLLTQAAILTVSSYPTRTSVPVRGKWVLENLLGTPPPPPPPNVPVLEETKVGPDVTMRERLEQHRKDPTCSPCHNAMDPIGFGLESYDAVGAWRTHDKKARIDTSGVLPDGKSFQGAKDLKKILRGQSDAFTRNLTEKLLTFALGRGLERYDRSTVEAICRKVADNNHKFSTLVLAITESRPFQMRTGVVGGA
jgi:hypothetical protein